MKSGSKFYYFRMDPIVISSTEPDEEEEIDLGTGLKNFYFD